MEQQLYFFWIPFRTGLRFWVMGEWGLVAIIELQIRKKPLLFTIYSQVIISRRQTSNEKGMFNKFLTFDLKQIHWVTMVYIFPPSVSASFFKQRVQELSCGKGFWSEEIPPCRLNFSLGLKYSPHPGGFFRTTEMPTTLKHSKLEKSPCLQHNCWKLSHPLEGKKAFLARKLIIRA